MVPMKQNPLERGRQPARDAVEIALVCGVFVQISQIGGTWRGKLPQMETDMGDTHPPMRTIPMALHPG